MFIWAEIHREPDGFEFTLLATAGTEASGDAACLDALAQSLADKLVASRRGISMAAVQARGRACLRQCTLDGNPL